MGKKPKKSKSEQQLLDYSILSANTLFEETRATNVVITWPVKNYSKIKKGEEKTVTISSHNNKWMFILKKNKSKLKVTLHLANENIVFGIRNSDGQIFDDIFCKHEEETFVALIENKTISDPENKLLNDDTLILQWRYPAGPSENNIILMPGLQSTCYELMQNFHMDSLCNDLRDLYLSAQFYDFHVFLNGNMFKAHKFILCARSPYFERMANDYPGYDCEEIECNVDSEIMHQVLLYVYSSYLTDMHVSDMVDVFDIACILEFESLVQMCKAFFKRNFSVKNLALIASVVVKHDDRELSAALKKFLDSQPESVLQLDEWIEASKKVTVMLNWMEKNPHKSRK